MNHREFVAKLVEDPELREAIRKFLPVDGYFDRDHDREMTAYAAGYDIQSPSEAFRRWTDVDKPAFHRDNKYRKKPKTKKINGFTVPAAITSYPDESKLVYYPNLQKESMSASFYWSSECENAVRSLERGLLYESGKEAIAAAKAMLGIDPEWEGDQ